MSYTFALVGNPNSGKTTMFNYITGSTQYVGNWPGVTVEKKEGRAKRFKEKIKIVDLPGIYSLSPYTLEEVISRDYIVEEKPDVVINIIDASNIERNLYLTMQLKELGVPVVGVLNMIDVVRAKKDKIDIKMLEEMLGIPIVPASASKGEGINDVINKALQEVGHDNVRGNEIRGEIFEKQVEETVLNIQKLIEKITEKHGYNKRWLALKLLEQDKKVLEKVTVSSEITSRIKASAEQLEKYYDNDMESIIAGQRYRYISSVINRVIKKSRKDNLTTSDKIDKIVTNRILAIPIFLAIMWVVYYVSIKTLGDYTIGWVEWLIGDVIASAVSGWLQAAAAAEWLHGLVVDGIIGGVGAVLVFVPQIMILFFFISLLEDSGYIARLAFVMDRFFRKFGLTGKSFIPMLIGSGCSVPGIMATRTLENDKDRKLTIMLTPFISCGAKLPVYVLFAAAFFPGSSHWIVFSLYILGIAVAILSGILLKKTVFKGKASPFVMELPEYRIPTLKGLLIHMWDRGKAFMIKAGTIILVASGIIWMLQSFNGSFQMVEDTSKSMLAAVGRFVAPVFAPLGFGDWMSSVATLTGLLAKEVVVATMGILNGLGEVTEDSPELIQKIQAAFTPLKAYSFMVFTLLAVPCIAAIAAMKREFNSWKWTIFATGYQTGIAWIIAFLIFQIGKLYGAV